MSLSKKEIIALSVPKFKAFVEDPENGLSYTKLDSIRKSLVKAFAAEPKNTLKRKINISEKLMRGKLQEGVTVKRRIPGTGTRVVTKHVYKDSAVNRKHGRVDKEYERVTYKDAEYETIERKRFRRFKRKRPDSDNEGDEPKPKKKNLWIQAMGIAKKNLDAPRLTIVRSKITDPSDERQVMGHKVYLEAVKQMGILKEQMAQAKETAAEASA